MNATAEYAIYTAEPFIINEYLMSRTALQQLQDHTIVVVDSSDLDAVQRFQPVDATTNPSLITAAAQQSTNLSLLQAAFKQACDELALQGEALQHHSDRVIDRTIDILTVKFGVEILKSIQGRVSTEVDAALSYDTAATIAKADELLALYAQYGISRERILIKIASTWEGIQAARELEARGIHCNLTLLFNLAQAQACSDAGVTLISPFVGRILDWYKKTEQRDSYPIEQDPGVLSVKTIYQYYKQHGIQTQVMGASFRSTAQVLALTGCDLLTISPQLLGELSELDTPVAAALSPELAKQAEPITLAPLDQAGFHAALEADPMASQLLQGGIDGFIRAREQLADVLRSSFGLGQLA